MIVAKNCCFGTVFPQISCGRYPPNSSKFPKPHFLLTCTYFRGRRHGRNLPMAKATDGLAFGTTRHCRIEGLPPMPPTPQCARKRPASRRDLKGSGAHPKRQSPSRFCVQAIAELQPQKSRNVAFGTPKNNEMKSCPSHCETAATRQSPKSCVGRRIRKGRAPAGFASKPLQECSLKNLETLLLEPLKTMKWNRASATAKLQPPGKAQRAASGAHPKRQSPSRFCVQAIAGVQPQKSRNVAFGTPKNNEIVPQPLRNFSHQAKPKKAASGAHPKTQSPSRFCVQAIAELQPQKSRNVAFGTPKNNEMKSCPSHCETAATR